MRPTRCWHYRAGAALGPYSAAVSSSEGLAPMKTTGRDFLQVAAGGGPAAGRSRRRCSCPVGKAPVGAAVRSPGTTAQASGRGATSRSASAPRRTQPMLGGNPASWDTVVGPSTPRTPAAGRTARPSRKPIPRTTCSAARARRSWRGCGRIHGRTGRRVAPRAGSPCSVAPGAPRSVRGDTG
jgi:hypothetical protein